MAFSEPIVYDPFPRLVGLTITRRDQECSQCVLEVGDRLMNTNGVVHGGAIYTLTDVGMGTALRSHMADDERCTTLEIKINYLSAVTSGVLACKSTLVHRSRRLAVLESEVTNGGTLVAKATGTYYISEMKQS